jgi:hypothetical protein
MARIGAEGCDVSVITDHHPRFEDPASIRKVLVEAAKDARPDLPIFEVSPPEVAIRKAVSLAVEGDAILWCGLGPSRLPRHSRCSHPLFSKARGSRSIERARLVMIELSLKEIAGANRR